MEIHRRHISYFLLAAFLLVFPILLTSCQIPLFQPAPKVVPSNPHEYRLKWLDQEPQFDWNPAHVPVDGTKAITVKFALSKPLPEGAVLGLYLHKDRSQGRTPILDAAGNPTDEDIKHWTSTPGPNADWFDSMFRHFSWTDRREVIEGEPAFLVATASKQDERPCSIEGWSVEYWFKVNLAGNGLDVNYCQQWHEQYKDIHGYGPSDLEYTFCREDFGLAFVGSDKWLLAIVGEGGRPESYTPDSNLGHANAWWHLRLCDNNTFPCDKPPGLRLDPNLLAFLFVCVLWLLLSPFRSSPFIRGLWIIIGVILLLTMIGWVLYATILDPAQVSPEDYDLARRQAAYLIRAQWEAAGTGIGYLQPYDCTTTLPEAQFFGNPPPAWAFNAQRLNDMSAELNVAIVPCPRSTWSYNQPGAILTWRDIYGTHTMFLFGAQWKLYQQHYPTLNRPSSNPYPLPGYDDRIAIDFGMSHRLVYKQTGQGQGWAWIQTRKTLFWQVPDIFCIPGLTANSSGECWTPEEPPPDAYQPYAQEQSHHGGNDDWAYENPIPTGGWWAPLNVWKSLALGIGLYLAYFLLIAFYRFLFALYSGCYGSCIGQVSVLLSLGVLGASVMCFAVIVAFASPHALDAMDSSANFVLPVPDFLPGGPIGLLVRLATGWLDIFNNLLLSMHENLLVGLGTLLWIAVGGFLGMILMPIWAGMSAAGVMGAWIGAIVEVGLLTAGVVQKILPPGVEE